MKFITFILFFLVVNSINPDTYLGKWKLTGGSIIEIYKKGAAFEGIIVQRSAFPIHNRNGLDNKNPNSMLRKRAIVGLVILNDLRYIGGGLSGGSIYNSDSGNTYQVKLLIDKHNANVCHVSIFNDNESKKFKIKRVLN